jgi:hypothetical protein
LTKGFISYAHDDHRALDEMCKHLKAIERAFNVDFWRDRRIRAGDYWTTKVKNAIDAAKIHLLLITPSFIERPYIMEQELPAINAKYKNEGDLVLPVVLDRCMWKPFIDALQAVPMSPQGRLLPVTEWRPQKHGYHAVCEQIEQALKEFLGTDPDAKFDWKRGP